VLRAIAPILGLLLVFPLVTEAKTFYVANDGVDSSVCGPSKDPCRTISHAIVRARDGDKIRVGPGHYGDLNRDGDYDDFGEESAEIGVGCNCVVDVAKRLTIESTHGRTVTLIRGGPSDAAVVRLSVDRTRFGRKERGFTVTNGGDGPGVLSEAKTTIEANRAVGARFGFEAGSGTTLVGNEATLSSNHGFKTEGATLEQNVSRNNDSFGFEDGGGNTYRENLALNNFRGFSNEVGRSDYRGDVASSNSIGMFFLGAGNRSKVSKVMVSVNQTGIWIEADGVSVDKSSITGNSRVGVRVEDGGDVEITGSNIVGNGAAPLIVSQTNCGVLNLSSEAPKATRNWWGDAVGPGMGPGQDAACAEAAPPPLTDPPAKKPTKVKNKAPQ
jgi:hypothetical protein